MTAMYRFYEAEWRTKVYKCPVCGWHGAHGDMSGPNLFRELMDFGCPECDKMLLIISYPTLGEIVAAARDGNEEAKWTLSVFRGEGEAWEEYKREIEAYNRSVREAWLNFDGPKHYMVKSEDGYTELDEETASNLIKSFEG